MTEELKAAVGMIAEWATNLEGHAETLDSMIKEPWQNIDGGQCRLNAKRLRLLIAALSEPGVTEEIAAERKRQIEVEGWTPEHDDEYGDNPALALAAASYAVPSYWRWDGKHVGGLLWPFDEEWLKPSRTRRRDLVKAGALIVAEIERLDRAAALQPPVAGE